MATEDKTTIITITVDGVPYRWDVSDYRRIDEQDLYHACKMSVPGVINAVQDGQVALFMLAALVFMARRQAGDKTANYETIADAITYDTDIDINVGDGVEGDGLGEAPADD